MQYLQSVAILVVDLSKGLSEAREHEDEGPEGSFDETIEATRAINVLDEKWGLRGVQASGPLC